MTDRRDEGRRPTLLILSSTYPRWENDHEPGFVHELAKRLTDRFRVIALVPHAPGARRRENFDGVDVVRFRYAPEFSERLAYEGGIASNIKRSIWKALLVPGFVLSQLIVGAGLIRRERVHLVHAHWAFPQGVVARLLSIIVGVNYVLTCHGGDLHGLRGCFWTLLRRFASGGAKYVTTVSGAMRQLLEEDGVQDVEVMPMGVDMATFVLGDPAARSSSQLLFVGRLVPSKGCDILLRAMPEILKECRGVTLTIVGAGPELPALHNLSRALGISSNVEFAGPKSRADVAILCRGASLLVAPYTGQEGFGLVLVEALASGCPVVTTRVAAVEEIFVGCLAENLAEPGSIGSLASAVVTQLARQDVARERTAELHSWVEKKFSWQASSEAYSTLLANVAARHEDR